MLAASSSYAPGDRRSEQWQRRHLVSFPYNSIPGGSYDYFYNREPPNSRTDSIYPCIYVSIPNTIPVELQLLTVPQCIQFVLCLDHARISNEVVCAKCGLDKPGKN